MVWFQCEDCGDNLKKPKLPNHFRICSAFKLSCIDCGEVFGQHNVESHTQCITEAEKYGPKGQGKASNGVNKPKSDSKPKPEVDITVGLSERPPWFCSLCNTKATSKQALLLHADGKKHRAKARAFNAANQKPKDASETNGSSEKKAENDVPEVKDLAEPRDQKSSKVSAAHDDSKVENTTESNKKRKSGSNTEEELGNSNGTHSNGAETAVSSKSLKKVKHNSPPEDVKPETTPDEDSSKKNIKWKKLITSALKSNRDCSLKFKELKKLVAKSLKESGYTEDKTQVYEMLQQKVNSSSRFIVDGKYIRLDTSTRE